MDTSLTLIFLHQRQTTCIAQVELAEQEEEALCYLSSGTMTRSLWLQLNHLSQLALLFQSGLLPTRTFVLLTPSKYNKERLLSPSLPRTEPSLSSYSLPSGEGRITSRPVGVKRAPLPRAVKQLKALSGVLRDIPKKHRHHNTGFVKGVEIKMKRIKKEIRNQRKPQ